MKTTFDGLTEMPGQRCPACDEDLSAAGTIDRRPLAPQAGNWMLCAYCLRFCVFERGAWPGMIRPRLVSAEEWDALPPSSRAEFEALRASVEQAWASSHGRRRVRARKAN